MHDVAQITHRRTVLQLLTGLGIGSSVFARCLADEVAQSGGAVDADAIARAEWIAGIELTEQQREETAAAVRRVIQQCQQVRGVPLDYDELPALRFDPEALITDRSSLMQSPPWLHSATPTSESVPDLPASLSAADPLTTDDLAFASIRQLGLLLRSRRVTSVALTNYFLDRLRQWDPVLHCVVQLTEDIALRQAIQADRDFADGKDHGPLHGIPWGAKDLVSVPETITSWGAPQFATRQLTDTATVAARLQAAGAVLIAKLSLGALAMGDQWFGGQTRNPWNPEQGSSGSSAGPAAAAAAGLVPFAIGSETLGSIISPARRCGVVGLRPTFGRVSRAGCMSLSWSMDKIGPMGRAIDDCALVFAAIHGTDAADPTTVDRWFDWPVAADLKSVRIGQVRNAAVTPVEQRAIEMLQEQDVQLIPIDLPRSPEIHATTLMLDVEAAAVFRPLTAANNLQGVNAWEQIFRRSHFVSAVDYLQAARVRTKLMAQMQTVFEQVDLYIGGSDLAIANLTGHPCLAVPVMVNYDETHPQPQCVTLTGRLHSEAGLLAIGRVLESAAGMQVRPVMEGQSK
ncbi:MAG: amidase [Planctomycetaceae bacterium]|nr:amidase [Planctomycetaceae bacterium]